MARFLNSRRRWALEVEGAVEGIEEADFRRHLRHQTSWTLSRSSKQQKENEDDDENADDPAEPTASPITTTVSVAAATEQEQKDYDYKDESHFFFLLRFAWALATRIARPSLPVFLRIAFATFAAFFARFPFSFLLCLRKLLPVQGILLPYDLIAGLIKHDKDVPCQDAQQLWVLDPELRKRFLDRGVKDIADRDFFFVWHRHGYLPLPGMT
jgi:hypothetical protein